MKKFLSILSLSACAVLAVSSSAISVSAMPPRNGGSSTRGAICDTKVTGDAAMVRSLDNVGGINLSRDERAMVNQMIHNDEPISRNGNSNPYYGPTDTSNLARNDLNGILANHDTNMDQVQNDYSKSFK